MAAAIRHRGPDGFGLYLGSAVGLAHVRLSIIDLSEKSNQPLVDAELGVALVFNGTIYNYRELRRACLFKEDLGEVGRGNCQRYRALCR